MLLTANIDTKTIGDKNLFAGLSLRIEAGEKIGMIGRNGVGKTTLFGLLSGDNSDYEGNIELKRGARIVSTRQEHHDLGDISAVNYIVSNLPDYTKLKNILDTYPDTMGDNMRRISEYSTALDTFMERGYYELEGNVTDTLGQYQIDEPLATGPMTRLSGGQKRFVELVRVQYSDPDLALIDEPTNHMDFVAKAAFIDWFKAAKHAVVVITHDRDVLGNVSRIVELKDGRAHSYKGNYEAYLKQNVSSTTSQLQNYEIAMSTIANLKKQIAYAIARKPSWSGTADQKNPFVVMERRLKKQLAEVEAANPKPSFWIDQESAEALNPKMTAKYDKYKAKNIRIHKNDTQERQTNLLEVENLQLGYTKQPLFTPVSFKLSHGDHLQLVGRNGAGKTTLVKALQAAAKNQKPVTLLNGKITPGNKLRLSIYEQEIGSEILDKTLSEAVESIYRQLDAPLSPQAVMQALGNYLFDPKSDGRLPVRSLSGGQKARLQMIRMLAGKPNLLILDEPTNHLDLPSIEELEKALSSYHGAILYISHDSYFTKNVGGNKLELKLTSK